MIEDVEDPGHNAADPKHVKVAKRRGKRDREQELADFCAIMAEPFGRRFVHRLLQKAGVFRTSMTGSTEWTLFNEGQRNVGLLIFSDLDVCPEQYVLMMQEASAAKRRRNAETVAQLSNDD